jgi:hypothetical protein
MQPVRSKPERSEPVTTTNEEPSHKEQPLPLLIPEESLERAWLRVSITPKEQGLTQSPWIKPNPHQD